MRKFFSLIAAVLFAGSMMAQVTITPSAITAAESTEINATIEGVSLNITQGTVTADQIRIFKNQTITISAESNITSIVFTCLAKGAAKYGPGCFTAQEGYTFEEDGFTGTWTGSATSVSFEASANQVRASQIVVTLEGGAPVVTDTYTVAGNDAAIFGEAWNPELAANDMVLNDGLYKWEKAELNLTAGTEIQFKVVKNHSWDIAYPAQNYVVNIAEAGEYTLTITFDPSTEAVAAEAVKKVIPQYEVAEAIAAGLAENDEILVRGVITKMEFKGKNFAKFGSVNIYVADATGAEGAFEFYNCYSLNADTFRTSDPAYDPESTAWVEYDEVADENGNAIHVGDTVIAFGKYKLYNETHELNQGCYLTEIKHPGDAPVEEHTYTVAGSPAEVFGTAWDPTLEANDMQPIVGGEYTHSWQKENVTLAVGKVEFKVVEDHDWANPAYPAYEAGNYELQIAEKAIYTISIFFNETSKAIYAEAQKVGDAPVDEEVIYEWSNVEEEQIGATILGASGVEVSTVKIHTNTDAVPAIKFGSSYVYADGKWIAIKPAEGGFKAGDVLSLAAVFNNADDTKYAQIDLRAANGDTRIWMSDSASTINGRTSAAEPIVQTYTLEADQDSLFLGRYGNTGMFVTMLKVVREGGEVPPVEEHTYTVAGVESVFGTNWNAADENNDMVLEEGLYKWEKENLTLAAGNVEFKVCEDHAWINNWPAQNYQLAISEAGIYTITITFNAETKEIAANALKTGDAEVDPVVSIAGSMNSWNASANVMTLAEDKATATLALNLEAQTYEFKVVINGGEWRSNAQEFTRENATAAEMTGNLDNMHLVADVAGDYIFTWTFADNSLAITYPEAPVVPDTIKLDFNTENTTYAFVDNQYFSEYGSTDIYLSDINVNTSTHAFEGDGNYLVLDFYPENPNNVTGVYQALDETLDLEYTYMLTINGTDTADVEFADGAIQVEIGEVNKEFGMAQLALAGQLISTEGDIYAITALVIAYYDFLPEEGVEDVVLDPKAIKRLVNGQVVIMKGDKTYNMNGAVIR